jgi:hypothetical protein
MTVAGVKRDAVNRPRIIEFTGAEDRGGTDHGSHASEPIAPLSTSAAGALLGLACAISEKIAAMAGVAVAHYAQGNLRPLSVASSRQEPDP